MTAEPQDRDEEALRRFGRPGGNGEDKHASEWPPAIDLERLAENEPEQPRFIIPDWLPAGYATLFAGHGGVGKSAIGLHLTVCIASGRPFFGLNVQRRRVLYLSCEDRESVLHWRLARICAHEQQNLAALRGWLEIIDLVGHDVILWDKSAATGNTLTYAYGILSERMRVGAIDLLVVDGISDTFGGNENARGDVKRFVNSLVSLIPPETGAVLLIGHVPKPTNARTGATPEGYSGSTGWHNSARARWYLHPAKDTDDEGEQASGDLILDLQKSNLGRTDQSLTFRWDQSAHLFTADAAAQISHLDAKLRDRAEQEAILDTIRWCAEQDIAVPAAMQGPRTAYHVLSQCEGFPASIGKSRPDIRRFWSHVELMRVRIKLVAVPYTQPGRHATQRLALPA